jgi:type IV secretory pathway TraG/TraD family ATPase VirD4
MDHLQAAPKLQAVSPLPGAIATTTRVTAQAEDPAPIRSDVDWLGALGNDPSNLAILGACAGTFALLKLLDNGGKGKLASGKFAGRREKKQAQQQAQKQMQARRHNAVALYVGRQRKSLWMPDAERGTAVIGGPGSGKTFSVLEPALRSAIDQGFPVVVYDFKYPTQTKRLAAYAKQRGYDIRIFAPGFAESETCNVLDFLRDEADALSAREIAVTLNQNFKLVSQATEDAFFSAAGDQLAQAILMLAKSTAYPDIMMCQAILSLDGLAERLIAAGDRHQLNPWVRTAFGQFTSVAKSEKTVSSIAATAAQLFNRFMVRDVLGAFVGESTIPLDLDGKQMLIFGMDRARRSAVGPLVATVLHMVVARNTTRPEPRRDPLVLGIDELPTLYLPGLVQWLNENREDGLVTLIGFQNLVQLEKAYGRELARAILGGCASKAIFNPQESESAKLFADFLGEEETLIKQKSRSRSRQGGSHSTSDQLQRKPLFAANDFLRLPKGTCIFINPGYQNPKASYVPVRQAVKVPPQDLADVEASKGLWDKVQRYLELQSSQTRPERQDLEQRYTAASALLPEPKQPVDGTPQPLPMDVIAGML